MKDNYHSNSLCWYCERTSFNYCQWTDKGKPIPGWVAEPKVKKKSLGSNGDLHTFRVKSCPLFKRG